MDTSSSPALFAGQQAPPRTAPSTASQHFFQTYPFPAGVYDEALSAPGQLRPHWEPLVQALDALGWMELTRRWEQAQRLLSEHGVTYNLPHGNDSMERAWKLDALPMLVSTTEWNVLENALLQRVRLLNAILADVYGPQKLLQAGLLPPELVFAHPGFLRPCHGSAPVTSGAIQLYAADLGRSPDGQWWVLADYTQNPAGAGYALENRLIVARTMVDVLRAVQTQRLAAFFSTLHDTLRALAPRHRDHPRIVLLTPGSQDATYFEHVYLARYLGYTLVEDDDLTVRDQNVYLKTLAGLQPVDVILRRQADHQCDSLAFAQASMRGIAGLVQAMRAGTVAVANTLGSGWADTPALLAYLPALCRHLLSEELRLPSVPTWWCGQSQDFAYVLEHLGEVLILPTLELDAQHVVSSARLSRTSQRSLAVRLRHRPYAYAAQMPLALSTVPVWNGKSLQPGHAVLRVYVVASADGYHVMPGGLTRFSLTPGTYPLSAQHSDGSKDTWVLADTSVLDKPSLLATVSQPVALRRSGYDLPSRVADNLLWLGRYAERAEGAVRFLRSVLRRLTDDSGPRGDAALGVLLEACYRMWNVPPPAHASARLMEDNLLIILFAPQFPGSVRSTLSALHRVGTTVRDRISSDAWRILARLEQEFPSPQPSATPLSDALALLNHTLVTLAAFSGLGVENMTRGPGWNFLDMGRRLERASHTTTLLDILVHPHEYESALLDSLLEIADSSITYRTRYLSNIQLAPVVDLLLTDDSNPRSVVFQLVALHDHVGRLPRTQPTLSATQRLALMALSSVQLADIEAVCEVGKDGQRGQLKILLEHLLSVLPSLAETIMHHYLSHAEPARHLATRQGTVSL